MNASTDTITLSRAEAERIVNAMLEARGAMITGACNVRHTATKELLDDRRRYLEIAIAEMNAKRGEG